MHTINIKPLSVNAAWQGRRYKTKKYSEYEENILKLLPITNEKIDKNMKLHLSIIFFFSNKKSDIDNPTKLFIDILTKKYNFNDDQIYTITLMKKIVKKGEEKISWNLEFYDENVQSM